ncbi:MAG: 3-oxo-5-alpha-steroid 4-dehydrogenase [Candidatus Aminicenantes bacterium]|nr:3-oxo-5-alpha-steroid 4-dehydrogenase [Candidatus Aminicenantes bacterium]
MVFHEFRLFQTLLHLEFLLAALVFPILWITTAPYGRHNRPGWGPQISARLGWIFMEAPAALVFGVCFISGRYDAGITGIIFFLLWETHYINRSFIYPIRKSGPMKNMPFAIVFMAFIFNTMNGYLNGRYIFHFSKGYSSSWLSDPRFLGGVVLFAGGWAINIHSDEILGRLRKKKENAYHIPHGGCFKFVSCANYFGEIFEWTGWALATWSLPGLAFAVFTAANLIPRGRSHHLWYRSLFPDYPPERKAVIPYVF